MELSDIKGVGPKRIELLKQLHIRTPNDLLRFYPKEYLDYTTTTTIRDAEENRCVTLCVTVLSDPTLFYHKGRYIVSARVSDVSGKATLRWMNQPYRMQQIHAGETLFVNGKANRKRGVVFYNPQINRNNPGIVPVYSAIKGLTQKLIRDMIEVALNETDMPDILPQEWLDRYGFPCVRDALNEIHRPHSLTKLSEAKNRFSFEEALLYFVNVASAKDAHKRQNGYAFQTDLIKESFLAALPFRPTDAQLRVMDEIEHDMRSASPMNRLIQGDVGSGKTLVAQFALEIAVRNGRQCVMLAPTSILAEQHYENLKKAFPNACLYTGNQPKSEKDRVLSLIRDGTSDLIVGTHALFSGSVKFHNLGLVVTDEQHRFGVVQRAKMEAKGVRPDVLVMSATPIPRTLALLLYADLDLSLIDMLPHGRKPIRTYFVPQVRRTDMYRHFAKTTDNGERVYVVCPLIEETEGYEGLSLDEIFAELNELLPHVRIGMLHGQMRDEEKLSVMHAFRSGEISILVSTTVVEVGLDVPEATAIVIEGADHYGLATLHQLRGRVGRSERQSECYLLCANPSASAKERIETMIRTNDGFEVAQKDLEMRGMGDLFGVRQSGIGDTMSVLSGCSPKILELASAAANEVMTLPTVVYNSLIQEAESRYRTTDLIAHN